MILLVVYCLEIEANPTTPSTIIYAMTTTATVNATQSAAGNSSSSVTSRGNIIGTNNTRPYQTVVQLQSVRPTARSVTRDITSIPNDVSEERYWVEKFGLGKNAAQIKLHASTTKHNKFAHPRHVTLQVGTSSIVHQIIIGTTATAPNEKVMIQEQIIDGTKPVATSTTNTTSNVKHTLMVGICGPRVPLYGTTPQSKIHRALFSHSTNTSTLATTSSTNTPTSIIDPDRNVPTNGQLAISASLRNDGRLLAIGTMNGTIRIADTTTRATLCQFGYMNSNSSNNKNQNAVAPLPIRYVQWFRNGQHLVSMGDDAMVRIWKLGGGGATNTIGHSTQSSVPVLSCTGHGDAIRCGALYQRPQQLLTTSKQSSRTISNDVRNVTAIAASGSYDHTIRIWDMDHLDPTDVTTTTSTVSSTEKHSNNRCLHILHHGGPVETLLFMKRTGTVNNTHSPTFLISGGGTYIKVWDPFMGIEIHTIQLQHRKSITCMIALPRIRNEEYYDSSNNDSTGTVSSYNDMRLITGGLDGLMRVHTFDSTTGQLEFVHGIHVNIPQNNTKNITAAVSTQATTAAIAITSLAATVTGDRIAIGTANGTILVCQKGIPIPTLKRTNYEPSAGTYAFFTRGMNADPSSGDTIVATSNNKKRKLAKYDIALKQFRYSDALDEALATRIPRTVVAVLEELGKRQGLTIALSNRDEETLEPILSFIVRYITRPRFSALLIGVTNILINIYSEVTGQSEMIDELFAKLQNQISDELRTQKVLFRVVGQLDAILATNK